MNRRELILGAGAAVVAAAALPAEGRERAYRFMGWLDRTPRCCYIGGTIRRPEAHDTKYKIDWEPGTPSSPHTQIVDTWVRETVKSGYLLCYGDIRWMDRKVRLEDVLIRIDLDDKVFNHQKGYVNEPGLKITVTEGAAQFAPFGLASTHGLQYVREDMRDTYYVRKPYLRYDEERDIRIALGTIPKAIGRRTPRSGSTIAGWLTSRRTSRRPRHDHHGGRGPGRAARAAGR
uniref:Uncharacterized protein n=1 Tax=Caulobacter phage BL57 TaxID=3348355 RepID=A0AB74UKW4_9VIRU